MKKCFYICVILTSMLLASCVGTSTYDNDALINLSPNEEPKLAKILHKYLLKENSLYKNRSLTKYINDIGRKLINQIEDNKIAIKFFITDTSNYRAMAIPGGYVHITRGMLAALNNEDELAMVLAHEIAHIINRDYKLDSKIKNEIQLPSNESEIKTYFEENKNLLERYTQFNFEREFEADKIAIELAHATGYDVFRGINTLRTIKNHDRYFGYDTEGYSSYTHPQLEKRISKLIFYAKELPEPNRKVESSSDIYLNKIDGLIVSPSTQQGYFASGYYYNPKHRMRFKLPRDWEVTGYDKYVYLYNKNDNAYILLYSFSNSVHDPVDKHFLEKRWGLTITSNITSANFTTGYQASKTTQLSNGKSLTVHFIALTNKYDLALLKHQYFKESKVHPDLASVSKSVSLYKREASIQKTKKRIKIIKVKSGTTIEDLSKEYDIDIEFFKLINNIDYPSDYRTRQFVKVIE